MELGCLLHRMEEPTFPVYFYKMPAGVCGWDNGMYLGKFGGKIFVILWS